MKHNLENIPEVPENKDFWVVGTANREGSIDSNSYKKNLGIMATKNDSSSYYIDTYPENPKEGDIITFTDATPSKEYINGEWKDRSAGGGGLPQTTLLQLPTADGQITIGDYLSNDDLTKLEESGVAVAKCGTSNYVVVCEYDSNASSSSAVANFAFYGPTGLEFILKHSGSLAATWIVEMFPAQGSVPRITTTNPATNISSTTLQRYGFTQEVLDGIFSGKITALKISLPNHDAPSIWHIALAESSFGAWHIEMCPNSYVTRLIYDFDGSVGSIQREDVGE